MVACMAAGLVRGEGFAVDASVIEVDAEALDEGLVHIGQTGHAVRAVLAVRPDMTAGAEMQAVNLIRLR